MNVIWKFPLNSFPDQLVTMPAGAKILCVQEQSFQWGEPANCLWAVVEPEAKKVERRILMFGTGFQFEPLGEYIGTVQNGTFVWHFFDGGEQ